MKGRIVAGLCVTFAAIAVLALSLGGQASAPPGWSEEDLANLPQAKQEQVLAAAPHSPMAEQAEAKLDFLASVSPPVEVDARDKPALGIIDMQAAPFASEQYTISNRWQGMNSDGTRLTQVFAGASSSEPDQGLIVLIINAWPHQAEPVNPVAFDTPGEHGAVTITSVSGSRFNLAATDGTAFRFDLDRRDWA